MSRMSLLKVSPLALLLFLPVVGSTSSHVGAPWLSVEVPANPMDPATRDAAFVLHAYYHGNPARFPVTGTAEGLVDGERQSVELEFSETSRPGVYAVRQTWPAKGHWVITASLTARKQAETSVVLELGDDGGVIEGRYYGVPSKGLLLRSVRAMGGAPDAEKIEAALHSLAMKSGS